MKNIFKNFPFVSLIFIPALVISAISIFNNVCLMGFGFFMSFCILDLRGALVYLWISVVILSIFYSLHCTEWRENKIVKRLLIAVAFALLSPVLSYILFIGWLFFSEKFIQ